MAQITLEIRERNGFSMEECSETAKERVCEYFRLNPQDITEEIKSGRIVLNFPLDAGDSSTVKKIRSLLSSEGGGLEFYETYENIEFSRYWEIINKKVREEFGDSLLPSARATKTGALKKDSIHRGPETEIVKLIREKKKTTGPDPSEKIKDSLFTVYPVSAFLIPNMDQQGYLLNGPVLGYCDEKNKNILLGWLNADKVRNFIPNDVVFAFEMNPKKNSGNMHSLYALKKTRNRPALSGRIISVASAGGNSSGSNSVYIEFEKNAGKEFERITEKLSPGNEMNEIKKSLAIVLDGKVLAAPAVASKIAGGKCEISGNFSEEECREIVAKILCPMNFSSRLISFTIIPKKD